VTAYKLLTGKNGPLLNMEVALTNSYHVAQKRFEQQQRRAQRGSKP
jgi:hypothetical protein